MLKHLPQLMKFKTAMDVRIGLPNEHLAGSAKNEINQPMYATSVGLIMRGFEYLETYKKSFNAGTSEEFVKPKAVIADPHGEEEEESFATPVQGEEKISLTEKIKIRLSKMFEVEDQPINK
jgi:cell division protein FtsA